MTPSQCCFVKLQFPFIIAPFPSWLAAPSGLWDKTGLDGEKGVGFVSVNVYVQGGGGGGMRGGGVTHKHTQTQHTQHTQTRMLRPKKSHLRPFDLTVQHTFLIGCQGSSERNVHGHVFLSS